MRPDNRLRGDAGIGIKTAGLDNRAEALMNANAQNPIAIGILAARSNVRIIGLLWYSEKIHFGSLRQDQLAAIDAEEDQCPGTYSE